MYTGFISEVGRIVAVDATCVEIRAPKTAARIAVGGSLNVAGVCLSAESAQDGVIRATLSDETCRRSTLAACVAEQPVNVEAPLRATDPLDGHLVQGHVDAVGKVTRVDGEGIGRRIWIRPPERLVSRLVAKGSIAVDGVSLTIAEIVRDRFSVALVPSTLASTTLGDLDVGARVNLEADLLAKLGDRHGGRLRAAVRASIRALPWAGVVHGALGVEKIVAQIRSGGAAIVWDPEREGEGDVIFAGEALAPEAFAFILTEVCGYPCVPCDAKLLERLEIPPQPGEGDRHGTAMHVSVDWVGNGGTGVSAAERAASVRHLADPTARPDDFLRPGHVIPLAARPGGVRERAGHTEATVELCRAAGLAPVGVCCEVMNRDGRMAGFAELERLSLEWGSPMVDLAELVARL